MVAPQKSNKKKGDKETRQAGKKRCKDTETHTLTSQRRYHQVTHQVERPQFVLQNLSIRGDE